jgi:hypothetical protein
MSPRRRVVAPSHVARGDHPTIPGARSEAARCSAPLVCLVRTLILELVHRCAQRSAIGASFISIFDSIPGNLEIRAELVEQFIYLLLKDQIFLAL